MTGVRVRRAAPHWPKDALTAHALDELGIIARVLQMPLRGHFDATSSRPLDIPVWLAKKLSERNVNGCPR